MRGKWCRNSGSSLSFEYIYVKCCLWWSVKRICFVFHVLECAVLVEFLCFRELCSYVLTTIRKRVGKRDHLQFRIDQSVACFSSHQRTEISLDCTVCAEKGKAKSEPRAVYCWHTNLTCSFCKVHLCCTNLRQNNRIVSNNTTHICSTGNSK